MIRAKFRLAATLAFLEGAKQHSEVARKTAETAQKLAEGDVARAQVAQTVAEGDTSRAHAARRDFTAVLLHVSVNEDLALFHSVLHQEIRNPMQIIMAQVEVLEHLSMTTVQSEAVSCIAEAVTVMKQLADSVLDLAKIEAGKMTAHLSPFNLRKWLASVTSGFKMAAAAKKLQFSVVEVSDLPATIEQDQVRLRQVITNVLSNAIKVRLA
jgi:signal transduction histidine kinase